MSKLSDKVGYTAGPWEKDYGGTIGHIKSLANKEKRTPTVIEYNHKFGPRLIPYPQQEANARLIAAAPAMLEALNGLMQGVDDMPPLRAIAGLLTDQWEQAREAIESATSMSWEELNAEEQK